MPAPEKRWFAAVLRGSARVMIDALLCDRDGTLVVDVPYNGDPTRVVAVHGVADALSRARRHGLRIGIVTNQSGLAHGRFDINALEAVHRRIARELGPFDVIVHCPHDPAAGCPCRKPAPGLVLLAARRLGIATERCLVIGDTGADVAAADSAGALGILVPNHATRPGEVLAAVLTGRYRSSFASAVDDAIAGNLPRPGNQFSETLESCA